MHYRSFRDPKVTPADKKHDVAPYNKSQLLGKFKETHLGTVTAIEKAIARATAENQKIADAMAATREDIEERKVRIDDRTIGLLSFGSVVQFYSRILDTREYDANVKLSDPVDDLAPLEEVVEKLEAGIERLSAKYSKEDVNEMDAVWAQDTEYLEMLRIANGEMRSSGDVRRARLALAKKVTPEKPKLELTQMIHMAMPEAAEVDVAAIGDRIASDDCARVQKRVDDMREAEIALRSLEDQSNQIMMSHVSGLNAEENNLKKRSERLRERNELILEIDTLQKKVDELQCDELTADDTTEVAHYQRVEKRIAQDRERLEALQQRNSEMRLLAQKKGRVFKKNVKKLDNLESEIEGLENTQKKKEAEVVVLERRISQAEMMINQRLKEAQAMTNYVLPPEVYEAEEGRSVRMEAIQTVVKLVGIDRTS